MVSIHLGGDCASFGKREMNSYTHCGQKLNFQINSGHTSLNDTNTSWTDFRYYPRQVFLILYIRKSGQFWPISHLNIILANS